MNPIPPVPSEPLQRAAHRLHHLSLRYVGALVELARGQPVGLIPMDLPGRKEVRDLIDLVLLTRAEINGLTRLLLDAGVLSPEAVERQFAEEYEWFAKVKAEFLGCEVTDHGLAFKARPQEG